jgi:hypothetical protein
MHIAEDGLSYTITTATQFHRQNNLNSIHIAGQNIEAFSCIPIQWFCCVVPRQITTVLCDPWWHVESSMLNEHQLLDSINCYLYMSKAVITAGPRARFYHNANIKTNRLINTRYCTVWETKMRLILRSGKEIVLDGVLKRYIQSNETFSLFKMLLYAHINVYNYAEIWEIIINLLGTTRHIDITWLMQRLISENCLDLQITPCLKKWSITKNTVFLPDIVNRHMYLRKSGHTYELPYDTNRVQQLPTLRAMNGTRRFAVHVLQWTTGSV